MLFSIDTWNKTLFLKDKKIEDRLDWFLERIERVETLILDLIIQLENANTDVILGLGLSKFKHREKFRKFAKLHGFEIQLHFLDIPKETRLQRVLQRNSEKGDTFQFEVSQADFDFMESWFAKPTAEEMQHGIVVNT
ncbi:AAA family ATPase [Lacinutrix cladophorae]